MRHPTVWILLALAACLAVPHSPMPVPVPVPAAAPSGEI